MQIVIEISDNDKQKAEILKWLADENNMVLTQAYIYAKNLDLYGVDVSEKWSTVIKQAWAMERAYCKGRYDEAERRSNESNN